MVVQISSRHEGYRLSVLAWRPAGGCAAVYTADFADLCFLFSLSSGYCFLGGYYGFMDRGVQG